MARSFDQLYPIKREILEAARHYSRWVERESFQSISKMEAGMKLLVLMLIILSAGINLSAVIRFLKHKKHA
jgi:ABC-type lipoprotein release transport system permease subunit